jgi:hypothetical protein
VGTAHHFNSKCGDSTVPVYTKIYATTNEIVTQSRIWLIARDH